MKKLKIVTVVGTRPEIIRLSRVLAKLDEHCEHVLVHTGQNYDYELNQIFFDDLGIRKPDHFLNAAGTTGAAPIGNVIIAVHGLSISDPVAMERELSQIPGVVSVGLFARRAADVVIIGRGPPKVL